MKKAIMLLLNNESLPHLFITIDRHPFIWRNAILAIMLNLCTDSAISLQWRVLALSLVAAIGSFLIQELSAIRMYQNQLAAVDYIVALRSDIFVYTYDDNMARSLQGHKKFEGFLKTINPDRQAFVELIDDFDKDDITRMEFEQMVRKHHARRLGGPEERKTRASPRLEENFYANPLPGCLCR